MKLLPANEMYMLYDQDIKKAGCNRIPEVIKERMGIFHYVKIKHLNGIKEKNHEQSQKTKNSGGGIYNS